MPRFWALMLLSLVLKAGSVLVLMLTIYGILTVAANAAPIPATDQVLPPPLPPIPTFELPDLVMPTFELPDLNFDSSEMRQATQQLTVMFVVSSIVGGLIWSLALYGAGQFIDLMLQIEVNTRGRRAAYSVPSGDPDDLPRAPRKPTPEQTGYRPMSEADRRALNASRRFQNPKRDL